MVERRDLGSWLQGPDVPSSRYPGERLGRPESGPGSVAGTGRRFAALTIDWVLCLFVARALFGPGALAANGSLSVVGVLVAENALLIGTVGATVGQRLVGVQVERVDAGPPGPLRALVRAVLLGLAIPALTLLWNPDHRGLHDLLSGTLATRRGTGDRGDAAGGPA